MAVRTVLTPAAREQGTVLGLGSRETNQSPVPVLSTELSSRLQGTRQTPSPPSWSSQSGGESETVNETSPEEQ